jgi:hypothetical protein
MTVAKSCTICGDSFSNKSNLNRHAKRFHMTQKKKMSLTKKRTNTKTTCGGINVQRLNKILWQLLLQLIEHKRVLSD